MNSFHTLSHDTNLLLNFYFILEVLFFFFEFNPFDYIDNLSNFNICNSSVQLSEYQNDFFINFPVFPTYLC